MSDTTDRPDDEQRRDRDSPPPPAPSDDAAPESVLTGFSWDDPAGAAPTRPEDGTTPPAADPEPFSASGSVPSAEGDRSGSSVPGSDQAPAQYPPAAPYPPAGTDAGSGPYAAGPYAADPYSAAQDPTGSPGAPADGPSSASPYGSPYGQTAPEQSPYGQTPPETSPYGQPAYGGAPQPYGAPSQGYGSSAGYTTTPQPYSYGPAPLSPQSEKVRGSAILWTILNGVSIFACANLGGIIGVILAAIAIGKARDDVAGARRLVTWSWIAFIAGFVLWILAIGALVVVAVSTGTSMSDQGF